MSRDKLIMFSGNLEALDLFSDKLKDGFVKLGYEIFDFNLKDALSSMGKLYEFIKGEPVKAFISFNSTFYSLNTPSGVNMWEALNIPCINILVDHPFWYHDILDNMPSNGVVICIDDNHRKYVERFFPQIPVTCFLPHAGTKAVGESKPWRERKNEVLYAGWLADEPDGRYNFSREGFDIKAVLDEVISYLKENEKETIEAVFEKKIRALFPEISENELKRLMPYCTYIERKVSSYFREKIVGAVARSGLSLTLYGAGWERCDWVKLPNVDYKGTVSPKEIIEEIADSKIVLNTVPWFKYSGHERIYNALINGALIFTEENDFLRESFENNELFLYNLDDGDISAIPDRMKEILNDEKLAEKLSTEGIKRSEFRESWEERATEIHECLLKEL